MVLSLRGSSCTPSQVGASEWKAGVVGSSMMSPRFALFSKEADIGRSFCKASSCTFRRLVEMVSKRDVSTIGLIALDENCLSVKQASIVLVSFLALATFLHLKFFSCILV